MANLKAEKIESKDLCLNDLYNDFYSVPDFQREYVWEPSNVEKLLSDIFDEFYDEAGRPDEKTEYFIGSVVACVDKTGTVYELIDGQQRMTTIYLVFIAIRDFLRTRNIDVPKTLERLVQDMQMDPKTGDDVARYRLNLQYEDSAGILEKIAAGNEAVNKIETPTKSASNIVNAYNAIYDDFLAVNFGEKPNDVKPFFAAFTNRVKLIRIVTPNLSHALKVFETINDRGVGLNAMDLLKNLLFMKTSNELYPKLKDKWKKLIDTIDDANEKPLRFLRYFIMANYRINIKKPLREDEIYEWLVAHPDETGIELNPLEFVDALLASIHAYSMFLSGKNLDGTWNRYLDNMKYLSGAARQHFILLLAGKDLSKEPFNELCRNIENLFFCYIITREPTKAFERDFSKWSSELRACHTVEDIGKFISKYITPDLNKKATAFKFAFDELRGSYIQLYRLRYILAKFTQYFEEKAWENTADSNMVRFINKNVDIEHILPQTHTPEVIDSFDMKDEYDEYVDRLGNLCLLEKTINASVSNSEYTKKLPGYEQSAFLLTKSLAVDPKVGANTKLNKAVQQLSQYNNWTSSSIDSRQALLTKVAQDIWGISEAGRNMDQ